MIVTVFFGDSCLTLRVHSLHIGNANDMLRCRRVAFRYIYKRSEKDREELYEKTEIIHSLTLDKTESDMLLSMFGTRGQDTI
jgi:hypothetical protein